MSQLVFLSLARSKMAIVRLPRALPKNSLFFVFTSVEGKGTPLPFEAPANHLASFFFPLPMSGDPRSLKCKHLRDPHVLLTVTFWLLDNFSSTGGGSIIPTSSSPWAITWHLFPASKTGEQPKPLSSAWDGDQNRRVSGRPCLAILFS